MISDEFARKQFIQEYGHIRRIEGRGSDDSAYYQALPFEDLSGRHRDMWAMRAKTYRYFEKKVLEPIERSLRRPLDVLDLGAGNCWMSYRLSLRNHCPTALDIFVDERDGLLAARHYPQPFPLVEAEFDCLPFRADSFDLIVFNSSLHYSTDYVRTLSEARSCLRRPGAVVVLDSPIYRIKEHGEQMVGERHSDFLKRYGFRSDAIPSIEFLDIPTLGHLSRTLQIKWQIYRPWYGWRWHLRPYKAWLENRRSPSKFWILVGRFEKR
jgi:ubiquinone/menaquinone biosynthesis C-methylase UbiE